MYEIQSTISDAWHSSTPIPVAKLEDLLNKLQKKIPSMSHWTTSDGQELVLVSDVLEALERAKNQKEII